RFFNKWCPLLGGGSYFPSSGTKNGACSIIRATWLQNISMPRYRSEMGVAKYRWISTTAEYHRIYNPRLSRSGRLLPSSHWGGHSFLQLYCSRPTGSVLFTAAHCREYFRGMISAPLKGGPVKYLDPVIVMR